MKLTFKQQIVGACFLWSLLSIVTGGLVFTGERAQEQRLQKLHAINESKTAHSAENPDEFAVLLKEQSLASRDLRILVAIGVPLTVLVGFALLIYIVNSSHGAIRDMIDSLSVTASAIDGASRSMTANSANLAQTNTETASSTETTASAIAEIHSMTVSNNTASKQALDTTVDCLQLAIKGQEAVTTVRTDIEEINRYSERMMLAVADNNTKLQKISELMREINSKTHVINDIVFQTKLLSFNASVEAARAGEHGKGFAVVAEEIGSLAKMSGDAAHEISHLLTDSSDQVQVIVRETVTSMDSVAAEIKEKISTGTSMSTKGHELITELLQGVNTVHEIMNGICQACGEQDTGITQVNNAIRQIEDSVRNQAVLANRYASTAEQLREQSTKVDHQIAALRCLFGHEGQTKPADGGSIEWADEFETATQNRPQAA